MAEKDYITYLETETVCLAAERDKLKAAIVTYFIELNCGRDTTQARNRIIELCQDKPKAVYDMVKRMYLEDTNNPHEAVKSLS